MCDIIIFAPRRSFEFRSPLNELIQTFGRHVFRRNRNSIIIALLISYLLRLSRRVAPANIIFIPAPTFCLLTAMCTFTARPFLFQPSIFSYAPGCALFKRRPRVWSSPSSPPNTLIFFQIHISAKFTTAHIKARFELNEIGPMTDETVYIPLNY